MKPIIVVGGPTASGKTELGVKLALKYGGEVVSADSMQIYKHMDIGSAKPTEEEMCGIPHHMIDIIEPTVNFSLSDYANMAHEIIKDIHSRKKIPVMVGGTGLYVDTVINNISLSEETSDPSIRANLESFANEYGNEALHKKLSEIDPASAENIHFNNVKRVIRAIEIFENTGITMTEHIKKSQTAPKIYKAYKYGIEYDREVLYDRINRRVDIMLENGLIPEVEHCLSLGCTRSNTSMQGIGYKEVIDFLEGKCTKEEMTDIIKQESRRYAKRQLTWFRRTGLNLLSPGQIPEINFTAEDDNC